jgi:hypothetical protein
MDDDGAGEDLLARLVAALAPDPRRLGRTGRRSAC